MKWLRRIVRHNYHYRVDKNSSSTVQMNCSLSWAAKSLTTCSKTLNFQRRFTRLTFGYSKKLEHTVLKNEVGAFEQKNRLVFATSLLKRRIKDYLLLSCAFSAQGAQGTNTKWQQHQGTSHNRGRFRNGGG